MGPAVDLEARVAALEARLDRLERDGARIEAAPGAPASNTEATADGRDGQLWALEGLRARAPAGGAVLFTGTVDLPDQRRADWQWARAADDLRTEDWAELADALGALSHPRRLRLLQRILDGTSRTSELVADDETGTSGQVHHHLRQLVAAGWLRHRARGEYEVPVERVVPLLVVLAAAR